MSLDVLRACEALRYRVQGALVHIGVGSKVFGAEANDGPFRGELLLFSARLAEDALFFQLDNLIRNEVLVFGLF